MPHIYRAVNKTESATIIVPHDFRILLDRGVPDDGGLPDHHGLRNRSSSRVRVNRLLCPLLSVSVVAEVRGLRVAVLPDNNLLPGLAVRREMGRLERAVSFPHFFLLHSAGRIECLNMLAVPFFHHGSNGPPGISHFLVAAVAGSDGLSTRLPNVGWFPWIRGNSGRSALFRRRLSRLTCRLRSLSWLG